MRFEDETSFLTEIAGSRLEIACLDRKPLRTLNFYIGSIQQKPIDPKRFAAMADANLAVSCTTATTWIPISSRSTRVAK